MGQLEGPFAFRSVLALLPPKPFLWVPKSSVRPWYCACCAYWGSQPWGVKIIIDCYRSLRQGWGQMKETLGMFLSWPGEEGDRVFDLLRVLPRGAGVGCEEAHCPGCTSCPGA